MNRTGRRRLALLLLAVLVAALHGAAALLLPPVHLGDGEHMPKRIEVAYVREMAPTAPPAAPPVVVPRRRAPRAAPAPAPKPAASAPAEPVLTAEAPAAAASAASAADALAEAAPAETEPLTEPADASTAAAEDAAASAVAAAASAAASAPAFEWPPSTRLSYSLHGNYRGEVLGAAMVEWVRAGSRYQVHLDVWIGAQAAPLVGRRMTSDGELTEHGLSPRRYDEETRALFRELRRRTIRFEPDRIVLPNGKELARPEGVQDAASQFVQLTWLFTTRPDLLRVGQRIELPLALPTKVVTWPYDIVGTATLDTPLGPIETFHVRPQKVARPGGDLVAEAWFAPSLAYLPIRLQIRQDEQTYVDMQLDRAPLQEAARSGAVPRPPRTLGAGDEPR
ncbi:MAG TPA: DUF3108 domain-containing protein [Rubrivivax sp.]|nr:DUF3108 domain-containing protein [Rubrivivax sp.]